MKHPDPISPLIGGHFSVAGGLENALIIAGKLGCNAVQLFSKNARTWQEPTPDKNRIRAFIKERETSGIKKVLSHASYLINIAGNDRGKLEKSIHALEKEMMRSSLLGVDYLVLHPGAHMGAGAKAGIEQAAKSLDIIFKTPRIRPRLLIETTAGQGTCLGHCFEQIAELLERTGHPEKTGVCMDTCHMFAAGYDISNPAGYHKVMADFDSIIGFHRLFAIHLNDSQARLGSKKDRHAHIGKGWIGKTGFKLIMNDSRFINIPKIIETPKMLNSREMDPVNLGRLMGFIHTGSRDQKSQ